MNRLKKYGALLAVIALAAVACDGAWKPFDGYQARMRCDRGPIKFGIVAGDFTPGQVWDIMLAGNQWSELAQTQIQYIGLVPFRHEQNQDDMTITIEKRTVTDDRGVQHQGYGSPGIGPDGRFPYRGFVWVGAWNDRLATLSAPSYLAPNTFRGLIAHEMGHAFFALEDMYAREDGHPQLLMGRGYQIFNQPALGDFEGARAQGCHNR